MDLRASGCGGWGEMQRLDLIVAVVSMCHLQACGASGVSVTTQRYDNARSEQSLATLLNTSNVNPVGFGELFTRVVDDEIYAQPGYFGVVVPNVGVRNVLYVGTVNNTVYAFDADEPNTGEPLWKVSLTDTVPGRDTRDLQAEHRPELRHLHRNVSKTIGWRETSY